MYCLSNVTRKVSVSVCLPLLPMFSVLDARNTFLTSRFLFNRLICEHIFHINKFGVLWLSSSGQYGFDFGVRALF